MAHDQIIGGSDTILANEKFKNEKDIDVIVILCSMRDVHCYDVNESYLA